MAPHGAMFIKKLNISKATFFSATIYLRTKGLHNEEWGEPRPHIVVSCFFGNQG